MRIILIFLVSTLFSHCFLIADSKAQWIASEGLSGGHVDDIKILDTTLFIARFGIYKKTIHETQWSQCLEIYTIEQLELTSGNVYAKCFYSDLLRSSDMGDTWQTIYEFNDYYYGSFCTFNNLIFLADEDSLFRSDDLGNSWINITGSLTNLGKSQLFASGSVLILDNLYQDNKLFRTTDNGNTWQMMSPVGLEGSGLSCIYQSGDTIWAGNIYGIYIYVEGGPDWSKISNGLPETPFISDLVFFQGSIYCSSTKYGIFRFTNGTWIEINSGLNSLAVNELEVNDTSMFCATANGTWQKNNNSSWLSISDGYNHLFINELVNKDSSIWACTENGLYKSLNAGESFLRTTPCDISNVLDLVVTDSAYYLAGGYSGVMISRDEGQNWESISDGLGNHCIYDIAIGPDYSFAIGGGLYRAETGIYQWEKIPHWIGSSNVHHIEIKDSILLASVWENEMYRSFDNGETFESVCGFAQDLNVNDNIFYAIASGDPCYSEDGLLWTSYHVENPWYYGTSITGQDLIIMNGGSIIPAGPSEYFLEISYDKGNTWLDIRDDLPPSSWPFIEETMIFGNRIFAAPNNYSLFYRDDLLTHVKQSDLTFNYSFTIYPNPFTHLISIENNKRDPIWLIEILDITGKSLLSSRINGKAIANLDLSHLKPGIYLIRVNIDGNCVVKKVVKQ